MFKRVVMTAATALAAVAVVGASAASAQAAETSKVVNVADRGASAYAPENTIAAITEAKTQHAQAVKIDVRPTKDGRLVLMHDATLARTTNVERIFPDRAPWRVGDFTLEEIRRLDAGSWFFSSFVGERVPTLGEALGAVGQNGLGVVIDAKTTQAAQVSGDLGAQPAAARSADGAPTFIVQSSDEEFLRGFHRLLPRIPTGLVGTPAADRLPALARFIDVIDAPKADVTADYVAKIHQNGMQAFTWTVDDEATMRGMADAGVDGILTTRPDALNGVLNPAPPA